MRITFVGNFGVDFSSETHHKKSLEALGHTVIPLQEGVASGEDILASALQSQLLVHIHTHSWITPGLTLASVLKQLKVAGIPTVTYHLDLWKGLQREKDLETDEFYKHIGHFFTVDKLMADWFNENTEVQGHYLPAGVLAEECYMETPMLQRLHGRTENNRSNDVIFVGSRGYHPEYPYRPQLIDWLKQTYGERFGHFSGEAEAKGLRRGAALNQLYADAKVAVGDSLVINFDYPYYWSDRLYETLGRGGFLIFPYIEGLEDEFKLQNSPADEVELITYRFGSFDRLKQLIDYYLEHEEEREAIRLRGHKRVRDNYTYTHRWKTILEAIGIHG